MASNYFYNSQSLGRPKRQTFSVYGDLQQQQTRKPFRPISNVFDYNLDPSNSNAFEDGSDHPTTPGSYYFDLNPGVNRKLTRHFSTLNPPVRHHPTHQPYKPDPPVINPAFLDGGILRPKILVDEHGFVIEDGEDDELTPPPPSMTSNSTRPYPQFEYSSLNPTSATQPNFHSHLTKNVQSQLSRLSAPVNPSDHSLQFLTLPRSLNPTNRHSNSSSDSSSTLVSSAGSSLHYHSGSDMSSAPNVASLSSSLYYVDCSANGEGGGTGIRHSGSIAGDSNRSSICSSSTITQSSIGSYQMGDPDVLPPPPPDLVNQHELLNSLPLPPPPPQHEHYNRPLSPAPPPPVSIVSLTTTPNRSYLDQPLPPPPNHEIVTTLRRKHFSLATDDSPYHHPMSTFSNTGTLTNRRRPAPPPPPSRASHVGPVGTKVTSSSPSPSTSSSSGISDSSSRSSGSSSHCSPSSMSTSFTSTSTYEHPKVMSSPSNTSNLHSPDYMSPMLSDPNIILEAEEVTFSKLKSNSPTYGWVYQAPQSPTTNSEDNLTSSTNCTHVHLDTFSMSDPGLRFTTMDRNNNSQNNQQPQTIYEYNNSAFVNDNRVIHHDDNDNRVKAKLNNPSYTLFMDDPSARQTSVDGGSAFDRPNDQLLGPHKQSKRSLPSGCLCCVRVTRCFVIFVCVLLLCFMLGVIGFTLYGRYNHGDRDGLSFWRRFFPLGSVVNYNSTISSETTTSFLPSTSVISTTLAPITLITTILKTSNQSELSTLSPFQSTPLFNQSESRPETMNQSNVSSILSTIKPESTTSSSVNKSDFTTPYSTPSLSTNPIKLNEPTFNTNNSPSKRFKSDSIDSSNDSLTPSTTILPFESSTNQTIITSQINAQIDNSSQTITNESVARTTEQPNLHQPSTTTSSPSADITTNFPVPPTQFNLSDIVTSSTNNPNITPSTNDTKINSNSSKSATKIFDDFVIDDRRAVSTISTLTTPSPLLIINNNNNMNETRDSRNMEDGNDVKQDYTTTSNPVNVSSINTESPEDESPDVINTDMLDSFIDDIFGDDNQTTTMEPQNTSLNEIRVNLTSTLESPEISSLTIPNHNTESNVPPLNSKSVSEISSVDTQPNITEIYSVPETTTTASTFTTIAGFNLEDVLSLLSTSTKNSTNVVSTESFNPTTAPSLIAES